MKKSKIEFCFISVFFLLSGCGQINSSTPNKVVNLISANLAPTDKVSGKLQVINPYNHLFEYKYSANRGKIIANNDASTYNYYAPFTGGSDTITIKVFDKTTKKQLPDFTEKVLVKGETLSYIDIANIKTPLKNSDNGLIKVASIIGLDFNHKKEKEIGLGRSPVISPEGKYIAYVRYQENGISQIVIEDPVGTETNIAYDKSLNLDPTWSPIGSDGKLSIIFSSNRNQGNSEIKRFHLWKVNIDSGELTQITKEDCNDTQPDWSPDGKTLTFVSNLDKNISNDYTNLYTLELATNTRKQLTHETASSSNYTGSGLNYGVENPVWSADSQKIVYSRKYNYRLLQKFSDIHKIWMIDFTRNMEGFGQIVTKQYDESIIETFPSWSPDRKNITFVRNRGSENAVISVELTPISNTGIGWSPYLLQDGLSNITEARWARQDSFPLEYNYVTGKYNIPYTEPTPTGSP